MHQLTLLIPRARQVYSPVVEQVVRVGKCAPGQVTFKSTLTRPTLKLSWWVVRGKKCRP